MRNRPFEKEHVKKLESTSFRFTSLVNTIFNSTNKFLMLCWMSLILHYSQIDNANINDFWLVFYLKLCVLFYSEVHLAELLPGKLSYHLTIAYMEFSGRCYHMMRQGLLLQWLLWLKIVTGMMLFWEDSFYI